MPEFDISGPIASYLCYKGIVPTLELANRVDLLIIPGSFRSVNQEEKWMRELEELVLNPGRRAWVCGVCFGHHLVAKAFGAKVEDHPDGWESGAVNIEIIGGTVPTQRNQFTMLESHRQYVSTRPDNLTVWATNDHAPIQGLLSREKKIFSTQFHPTKECL